MLLGQLKVPVQDRKLRVFWKAFEVYIVQLFGSCGYFSNKLNDAGSAGGNKKVSAVLADVFAIKDSYTLWIECKTSETGFPRSFFDGSERKERQLARIQAAVLAGAPVFFALCQNKTKQKQVRLEDLNLLPIRFLPAAEVLYWYMNSEKHPENLWKYLADKYRYASIQDLGCTEEGHVWSPEGIVENCCSHVYRLKNMELPDEGKIKLEVKSWEGK